MSKVSLSTAIDRLVLHAQRLSSAMNAWYSYEGNVHSEEGLVLYAEYKEREEKLSQIRNEFYQEVAMGEYTIPGYTPYLQKPTKEMS